MYRRIPVKKRTLNLNLVYLRFDEQTILLKADSQLSVLALSLSFPNSLCMHTLALPYVLDYPQLFLDQIWIPSLRIK